MRPRLRGLYVITPERPRTEIALVHQVQQAIRGGARIVQYRSKSRDAPSQRLEGEALLQLCRGQGVPLIINDNLDLAAAIGADGVHLGEHDATPTAARRLLGPGALIGVSCYNRLERALQAEALGADYVAFGRFFPSASKPQAVPAALDLLRRARRAVGLPLVAIGGIRPENGASLIAAGVHMLAVIDAVFGRPDIEQACRAFSRLFET